ncbi:MAG: MBL fold metallo-hydrolase [Phycisphaerales bacterium]
MHSRHANGHNGQAHSPPAGAPPSPAASAAALCILASGSSANCSILAVWSAGRRRACLIDAGISPRRAERRFAERSLSLADLDGILLTHLDSDHWHPAWARKLPRAARIHIHERHAGRARRCGLGGRASPFSGAFELWPGVRVEPLLASHDHLGSVAYRFDFAPCGSRLGFATDLGRVPEALVEHFRSVDVLALESNYCPRLQHASGRPWFLKRRIMGGDGHLSNDQCLRAVEAIAPTTHVVLLHLSQECNRPEICADLHAGADYALTISSQEAPTRWVTIARPPGAQVRITPHAQLPLFGVPPPAASSPRGGAGLTHGTAAPRTASGGALVPS